MVQTSDSFLVVQYYPALVSKDHLMIDCLIFSRNSQYVPNKRATAFFSAFLFPASSEQVAADRSIRRLEPQG